MQSHTFCCVISSLWRRLGLFLKAVFNLSTASGCFHVRENVFFTFFYFFFFKVSHRVSFAVSYLKSSSLSGSILWPEILLTKSFPLAQSDAHYVFKIFAAGALH